MFGPATTPVPILEATPQGLARANVRMQALAVGSVVRKLREEAQVRTAAADVNLSELISRLVQTAILRVDANGRTLGTILGKLVNAARNRVSAVGGPLEPLARRAEVTADTSGVRAVYVPETPPPGAVVPSIAGFGGPPPGGVNPREQTLAGTREPPEIPPPSGAGCNDPADRPRHVLPGLNALLYWEDPPGRWNLPTPITITGTLPRDFFGRDFGSIDLWINGILQRFSWNGPTPWPEGVEGLLADFRDSQMRSCLIGAELVYRPPTPPPTPIAGQLPPAIPPPQPPPRPPPGQHPPGQGPPPQMPPPAGCESPDPCRPPIFQLVGHDTYGAVLLPASYWVQICCLDRCTAEIWTYYADCPPPPRPGCRTIGPFSSISHLDYPALVRHCLTTPPPTPIGGGIPPPGGTPPPEPPPRPPRPPVEESPAGERCPRPRAVRPDLVLNEYIPVCRTYEEWAGSAIEGVGSYASVDELWKDLGGSFAIPKVDDSYLAHGLETEVN